MWMQVGSRAFFTGANQRLKKHEDEPKKQHSYLDGISKIKLASMNSLSQVCIPNSHFGHQIGMPTDTEPNEMEGGNSANQNCDCVFLSNPTMNELMETIKTKSTPDLNHLIVVGNTEGSQRLLMTHQLESKEDKKTSEKLNEPVFHRAYSADDITQLTELGCSGESLLLRIRSEGTLVPLPGIDSSLSKQMAILNPLNNESCTESAVSLINAELEGGFINITSDTSIGDYVNDNNKYMGQIPCKCCLCLGRAIDLNNGMDYQVKQAKQIVTEAVDAAREVKRLIPITRSVTVNASESSVPFKSTMGDESLSLGTTLYFISLAHLLLVIACLRGIF